MMMIRYTTSAAGGSATGMEEVRCYTRSFFFNIKYDSFKSKYMQLYLKRSNQPPTVPIDQRSRI
jgi:hypothetical protein